MDLKEAMKIALENEKKAGKLYFNASENSINPLMKKTFEYLANQETHHINTIKQYMDSENLNETELGDSPHDVESFFNTTIREFQEKTKICEEDIHAYETALNLEKESYQFYKELAKTTYNQKTKKFFEFLMKQENAHYVLLEKSYSFLKDPEHFHAEHEQWLFEG